MGSKRRRFPTHGECEDFEPFGSGDHGACTECFRLIDGQPFAMVHRADDPACPLFVERAPSDRGGAAR